MTGCGGERPMFYMRFVCELAITLIVSRGGAGK